MTTEQPTPPASATTALLSATEPHAVRWAQRDVRSRFATEYSPLYLQKMQAAAFLSLSESMFEKLVQMGEVPNGRKLSAGRTGWLVEELEAWGKALPVSDFLPPVGSGYGRAGKAGDVAAAKHG